MWNSLHFQYQTANARTQAESLVDGEKDTPPRSGLEWHLLRWKRHTGTRASFHCRSAIRRATPLFKRRKKVLAVNGEIYNHRDIRAQYAGKYNFQTGSDCEVILALYQEKGIHFLEDLSGIFAFALYDEERDEFLIARDPIGVIPLYIGHDADGTVYCASELKALEGFCEEYEPFLPGHYY